MIKPLQRRPALLGEQHAVFGFPAHGGAARGNHQRQHIGIEWFLEKVVGAQTNGLNGIAAIEIAGDDNDLGGGRERQDLLQGGQPLGRAIGIGWQAEVKQHHGGFMAAQLGDGAVAVVGDHQLIIAQAPFELLLQPGVVFHQQYFWFGVAHAASPSK